MKFSQMRVRYSLRGLYSQSYDVNLSSPNMHTHQACAQPRTSHMLCNCLPQSYTSPIPPSTWTSHCILRQDYLELTL